MSKFFLSKDPAELEAVRPGLAKIGRDAPMRRAVNAAGVACWAVAAPDTIEADIDKPETVAAMSAQEHADLARAVVLLAVRTEPGKAEDVAAETVARGFAALEPETAAPAGMSTTTKVAIGAGVAAALAAAAYELAQQMGILQ